MPLVRLRAGNEKTERDRRFARPGRPLEQEQVSFGESAHQHIVQTGHAGPGYPHSVRVSGHRSLPVVSGMAGEGDVGKFVGAGTVERQGSWSRLPKDDMTEQSSDPKREDGARGVRPRLIGSALRPAGGKRRGALEKTGKSGRSM